MATNPNQTNPSGVGNSLVDKSLNPKEVTEKTAEPSQGEPYKKHEAEEKLEQGPGPASGALRTNEDFEGGWGGQEELEDRYATTSGEH